MLDFRRIPVIFRGKFLLYPNVILLIVFFMAYRFDNQFQPSAEEFWAEVISSIQGNFESNCLNNQSIRSRQCHNMKGVGNFTTQTFNCHQKLKIFALKMWFIPSHTKSDINERRLRKLQYISLGFLAILVH